MDNDPSKNAYQVGIAARLGVDPRRVGCQVRGGPTGGFHLDVSLDGKDLTGPQQRLVMEYLEEAFHGTKPTVIDG
jgi:hypothetical protein